MLGPNHCFASLWKKPTINARVRNNTKDASIRHHVYHKQRAVCSSYRISLFLGNMRLWLVLSGIVTIVSEAAIFYPPFPSQGQFHEQPPTPPPVPTPPPHYNPYHGQHNLHASQNAHLSHIPHTSHNPHGSLLALIQMYLNQLRPPPPRYAPPMHVFLPHTPRPTETEGQSSANFGLPAQPEGGAVVDGSLAAGSPAENEGGTTTPPVGGLPGFSLGGLVVNGGAHDFPPLTPGSTGQIQRPRIYNLRNNVPNNPLPIGQIRNTFYERILSFASILFLFISIINLWGLLIHCNCKLK